MYCTFCIAKCLCKVSTSDIHSSFFRWHLKHDLTHGSKDQKGSHEEGEGGHMYVTKDGICKQFRPCIQKRVLSLSFSEKYKHPPCFHPSMSIIIYPYKSREMAKNRVVFFTWKWWQLNNSIDFACSLLLPLRKKPNSHNFRNMSKSGVISLIDWKIKKVGLDLVNYFFKDHPIEIDINPIESFFSNNFD